MKSDVEKFTKIRNEYFFDPEIPYLRNYFIDILIIHIYIYEVINLSIRCNTRAILIQPTCPAI